MKATIKIEKEVDITTLHVNASVRYWEDATVDGIEDENGELIPCKEGESWMPIIDIDSGKIVNWVAGTTADIHYKVCDAGVYTLFDSDDDEITKIDGYVPSIMCPEGNGYGDYNHQF